MYVFETIAYEIIIIWAILLSLSIVFVIQHCAGLVLFCFGYHLIIGYSIFGGLNHFKMGLLVHLDDNWSVNQTPNITPLWKTAIIIEQSTFRCIFGLTMHIFYIKDK